MEYSPRIGLEVHAQLATDSKLFCRCPNESSHPPNSLCCPQCLGYPGSLPRLNKQAVYLGVKTALALQAQVNRTSNWDRKSYFYPDLPKGYQITQYRNPLAENGKLTIPLPDCAALTAYIQRIHIEEDAGKSIHANSHSKIDFNRSGIPLIEIVTAPCFASSKQAVIFVKWLKRILQYHEISDARMEKGHMRCDANISLAFEGQTEPRIREIKNLNSFRFLQAALDYEIKYQQACYQQSQLPPRASLLWDERKKKTVRMRSKESEPEYRYLPEADLPPLNIKRDILMQVISETGPQLLSLFNKLVQQIKLPYKQAEFFASSPARINYYFCCLKLYAEAPKLLADWIQQEGSKQPNISCQQMTDFIKIIHQNNLSHTTQSKLFQKLQATKIDPKTVFADMKHQKALSDQQIHAIIQEVLQQHPQKCHAYKRGKHKLFKFFMGQAIKACQGRAEPQTVQKLLQQQLESL